MCFPLGGIGELPYGLARSAGKSECRLSRAAVRCGIARGSKIEPHAAEILLGGTNSDKNLGGKPMFWGAGTAQEFDDAIRR
jgi:hypothetical protein